MKPLRAGKSFYVFSMVDAENPCSSFASTPTKVKSVNSADLRDEPGARDPDLTSRSFSVDRNEIARHPAGLVSGY